jgi:putative membrane protein
VSIKLIIALILTGVAVVFIVQNAQVGELRFLVWTLAVSQALLLFFTLAIGLLTGWVLHAWFAHRRVRARVQAEAGRKVREQAEAADRTRSD